MWLKCCGWVGGLKMEMLMIYENEGSRNESSWELFENYSRLEVHVYSFRQLRKEIPEILQGREILDEDIESAPHSWKHKY